MKNRLLQILSLVCLFGSVALADNARNAYYKKEFSKINAYLGQAPQTEDNKNLIKQAQQCRLQYMSLNKKIDDLLPLFKRSQACIDDASEVLTQAVNEQLGDCDTYIQRMEKLMPLRPSSRLRPKDLQIMADYNCKLLLPLFQNEVSQLAPQKCDEAEEDAAASAELSGQPPASRSSVGPGMLCTDSNGCNCSSGSHLNVGETCH
jgi:hypothetical protein